jgi:hypothetical protein
VDYPLLHKGSTVLIGMCFLISDTKIMEGECLFLYMDSDGVIDPYTIKQVKVEKVRKRQGE